MRIALVSPLYESVPPAAYGGTERVIGALANELSARGHEVTLFAAGGSDTAADLVAASDAPLRMTMTRAELEQIAPHLHMQMLADVYRDAPDRFDIVHAHTDIWTLPFASSSDVPTVVTMHGRLDLADLVPLHRYFSDQPLVSISDSQRLPMADANWLATVHHGLPRDLYRANPSVGDYFVFIGRISPEKRVDRAIEIALACDTPLRIAAKVDPADQAYFEREIRALLDHPLVEFVGEIGEHQKGDFIGRARAMLFPVDWPEPFGLVMIEALACGTPIVAYGCGSVPEVLEDGVTGYIVQSQQEAIDAARHIARIDRQICRERFERHFTADRMASRYAGVYRTLVGEPIPLAPPRDHFLSQNAWP